jgi:hypothetical protein
MPILGAGAARRLILKILAAIVFCYAGISLYGRPESEILYNPWTLDAGCHESVCMREYILEIGNTGRVVEQDLTVHVRSHWLELVKLPPKAAMFGKVSRPMSEATTETDTAWSLGDLDSGKRIEVKFMLGANPSQELPSWDEMLIEVRSSSTVGIEGHPEWLTFARFLTAVFGF